MLIVLCTTEIISWGTLYYAFPVLLPTISSQTGWSQAAITAGFSASQVVAVPTLIMLATARLLAWFAVA